MLHRPGRSLRLNMTVFFENNLAIGPHPPGKLNPSAVAVLPSGSSPCARSGDPENRDRRPSRSAVEPSGRDALPGSAITWEAVEVAIAIIPDSPSPNGGTHQVSVPFEPRASLPAKVFLSDPFVSSNFQVAAAIGAFETPTAKPVT